MGFADRNAAAPWRERAGSGAAVVAIHLGLGVALLSTFAGGAIREAVDNALVANNWIYVPPPPHPLPTAKPEVRHKNDQVVVPPVDHGLDIRGPMLDTKLDLGPIKPLDLGGGSGGDILDLRPTPTPSPTFAPLGAVPRNNPGDWVTRNDYPAQAIREDWTGVTRFRVSVGPDGRVNNCEVTGSSGHEPLDRIACARITARARFTPARDESGKAGSGVYQSAIRWQLED